MEYKCTKTSSTKRNICIIVISIIFLLLLKTIFIHPVDTLSNDNHPLIDANLTINDKDQCLVYEIATNIIEEKELKNIELDLSTSYITRNIRDYTIGYEALSNDHLKITINLFPPDDTDLKSMYQIISKELDAIKIVINKDEKNESIVSCYLSDES